MMRQSFLFAGLGATLILTSPAVAADAPQSAPPTQSCRLVRMESLDVDTQPTGEIAVPVSLNEKPFTLLVDTGSDTSTVSADVAAQLNVATMYTPFGGAFLNNVAVTQMGYVKSFAFGRLHSSTAWPMFIAPEDVLTPPISGLVGADVLANYDIEFDFVAGKMNFFAPTDCPSPVYWSANYAEVPIQFDAEKHVVVDAQLDGKPLKVILDTGAPSSLMSLDAAQNLYDWDDNDPRVVYDKTLPLNGGAITRFYKYPFSTLSFGGVSVQNPKIVLIPKANFMAHRRDKGTVILGMSVIRQLHLFVAYREKKLFVTPAEQPPLPPPPAPAPAK
ncbi:MAG TPA: aspartyl protease family protein [Rhizomicrobium sp.]|jgi:predicted aspartyl protease|nr:aspartyl protease family protein [Rhizomicrobium sp.]